MAAQSHRMSVNDREGGLYGAGYLLSGPFTAVERAARDAEMLRSPVARNSSPLISRACMPFWGCNCGGGCHSS